MSSSGLANDYWISEDEACEPYKRKFGMSEQKYNEVINLLRNSSYEYDVQVEILRAAAVLCETIETGIVKLDIEQGLLTVKFKNGNRAQEQESPQGKESKWQDKVLARMHKPQDKFSSMEIRFLPPVRKLVDSFAASKGMAAAECVESIVVDTINRNPDLIEQGEKRLKEFGGNLTRVKRHSQEEKLARLEELEAKHSTVRR